MTYPVVAGEQTQNDISTNISFERVSLTLRSKHGEVPILHDVSLRVHEKEAVAVLGPSGSGKTSLLMLLAGLERASSGHIQLFDFNPAQASDDEIAAFRGKTMGIVFQAFHLIPTMTALENVMIPLEFAHVTNAREKALEALESVGLHHRIYHYPAQLSGGEQQRVAIARAFAPRPKLLLADEPTGNLDQATGEQVMQLLFDECKKLGTTMVLVTHDTELAKRCDRSIHLKDGHLV